MSVSTMLRWDGRLQFRYGFYAVYAVVTVLFGLGLSGLPASVRTDTLVMVLFADPGFLGFYFVGALVLFEKNEGSSTRSSPRHSRPTSTSSRKPSRSRSSPRWAHSSSPCSSTAPGSSPSGSCSASA
ncbi:hypothetical protein ACFQRB_19300 [Halobaculum litoreum]|uniref:Uncharacterized protein n=1 Tax=Halobaculum litoreum TaxID=3031998 RepID=A0ABD5Y0U1_9EURY